jgi:hypothetical protein
VDIKNFPGGNGRSLIVKNSACFGLDYPNSFMAVLKRDCRTWKRLAKAHPHLVIKSGNR